METEGRGHGGDKVLEKYQGCGAGLCGFPPFLERGNMLFKCDLKQETQGLLILNACRDLGHGSGLETQGMHHLAQGIHHLAYGEER